MAEDHHQRVEQMASAVEDMLQMGVIRLGSEEGSKAVLSPHFSQVISNVIADMKIANDMGSDDIMKLMYYSLLIYMSECLKMPRSLMMAFGEDLEKNRETMESGALITTYVSILSEIWSQNLQSTKKG